MVSDLVWAFLILGLAAAGLVGFVYHDVAQNRKLDEDFRRELEELREQYHRDE